MVFSVYESGYPDRADRETADETGFGEGGGVAPKRCTTSRCWKHPKRLSLTMPTACMKAQQIVLPTRLKPRRWRSLLMRPIRRSCRNILDRVPDFLLRLAPNELPDLLVNGAKLTLNGEERLGVLVGLLSCR